jgi:hypothetical protein
LDRARKRRRQGPNQGLHYLVGVPFAVEAEVHVNTIALSKGSAFWTGQPVRRGTNAQGQDLCSRADVVPFQSVVRRHEGIGLDPASHARLYRDELFRRAGPSLEDVVAAQAFQVVGLANTRFQAAMAAAQTESAKADQGSNVPTYCLFSGITY